MRRLALLLFVLGSLTACGGQSADDIADEVGCYDRQVQEALVQDGEGIHCLLGEGEAVRDIYVETFDIDVTAEEVREAWDVFPGSYCGVYGKGWLVQAWHEDLCDDLAAELGGEVIPLGLGAD